MGHCGQSTNSECLTDAMELHARVDGANVHFGQCARLRSRETEIVSSY
jgi:hypothetical protein